MNHKPDISKSNVCPPLPDNAGGLDKIVYWLGIGLGSGLPKKAPGTWGTVGGMIVGTPLMMLGFYPFLAITIVACLVGIWICDRTSNLMGGHDNPHIVFDEWAGVWIAMLPIAYSFGIYDHSFIDRMSDSTLWLSLLNSFLTFRFFDIIKPFPIGYLDKKLDGGLGIMLDDILAGIISCLLFGLVGNLLFMLYNVIVP